MSYNRVILMGRITHDLELRTTQSGISMCSFQMAVDRRFQTKGEERKSDFFRIVTWRQTADFVTRYFRKGSMILVEGELQTDTYTDKNGNTVNAVQVVAEQVSFTGEKANGGQGGYQGGGYQSNQGGYQQGGQGSYANNAGGYQQNGYANNGGYSQNNTPPQSQPSGGVPTDFSGASDDNYPF